MCCSNRLENRTRRNFFFEFSWPFIGKLVFDTSWLAFSKTFDFATWSDSSLGSVLIEFHFLFFLSLSLWLTLWEWGGWGTTHPRHILDDALFYDTTGNVMIRFRSFFLFVYFFLLVFYIWNVCVLMIRGDARLGSRWRPWAGVTSKSTCRRRRARDRRCWRCGRTTRRATASTRGPSCPSTTGARVRSARGPWRSTTRAAISVTTPSSFFFFSSFFFLHKQKRYEIVKRTPFTTNPTIIYKSLVKIGKKLLKVNVKLVIGKLSK